jgi:hypothetical protein
VCGVWENLNRMESKKENEKHRSGSAADYLKYEVFQEEGTQRAGPLRPSYFLHKSFVSGIYYFMIREL